MMRNLKAFGALAMFLCLIISANGQGKATFPVQKGLVVDAENDLDLETVAQLIKLVDTHKAKAADQIAVVTVTDYAPFKTLNEYAKELSNNWKLGNNSVTFAFSQKKSDVKIYVAPGLQTKLSDVIVQKIIQEKILPKFREGNVDQALINGVMEVIRLLEAK